MGIKSKIHDELAKAAGITPESGQDIGDSDYMKKLCRAVAKLSDDEWNKLSDKAGEFHNKLADAMNSKKDLPAYPDAEKVKDEEEEAPRRSRRRSAEDEDEQPRTKAKAYEPKKGDKVKLTTVKGKEYTGTVIDPDDDGELVIDTGDDEFGFTAEKIQSVELAEPPKEETSGRRRRSADDEDEPAASQEPEVGDTVEVKNKRGNVKVGNIVSIDDEELVIKDSTGDEIEYSRDRVESITIKVKNAGKKASGTKAKSGDDDGDTKGKTTKADNGGVSVTLRIREIMCEEPTDPISLDELGKRIKKEGLECKENTLKMVHADCTKLFGLLKAGKKLK